MTYEDTLQWSISQHNIPQLSSLGLSKGFNEYLGWLVFDAEGIFSGFLDGEAMHRSLQTYRE